MAGYRNTIIHGIGRATRVLSPRLLQRISGQRLIMPVYHLASDHNPAHIKHLYRVKTKEAFIQDLDFLLKHYQPIDYIEFNQLKKEKRQPKKPSLLLSFDDGLSEFYNVVAPILLQKGIPAICFLNSAFVDNKNLFFRYKASLLIEETKKHQAAKKTLETSISTTQSLQEYLLSIDYNTKGILDELAASVDLSFNDFLSQEKPYMTSSQIERLIEKGFHFGAHSIDHPEYQTIPLEQQVRQTSESVHLICSQFNLSYKAFSFPFTDYNITHQYFDRIQAAGIVEHSFGTAGQKKDQILNNHQRIPFEMNGISARQIHNSELLYYILKAPLGKNICVRDA